MGDKLDYTAQDLAQSMLYTPGARPIDKSVRDSLDAEREALLTAFESIEQDKTAPIVYEVQAQNISVGGPPAALVITGKNFGTDNTKVYLEVGPDTAGPFVATAAGHTDTNATFDISAAAGLTASRIIQVRVILQESALKKIYSRPVSVPTVA